MGWFRRNEHDEEQLSAFLDGELDARQAENVERHLATCDACAALLEELRGTRALLSALPAQTPTRSFVLGAEYARAPVRDVAAPSRRFRLALVPAVALSVFVALLFVDLASFSSGTDESAEQFTAATSREASDDASRSSAGAAELAPAAAGSSTMQQSDGGSDAAGTGEDAAANAASGAPSEAGGGAVASPEAPPSIMSVESAPSPAAGDTAITAAGEADEDPGPAPAPETLAFDAPEPEGDGGGISTLRVLQILAAAAFLASGIYVFVWPRVSRGGS